MLETNDVYRKIKEISKRATTPRPKVLIDMVIEELSTVRMNILPALNYLKDLRLIQFDIATPHVRLTLLGQAVTR